MVQACSFLTLANPRVLLLLACIWVSSCHCNVTAADKAEKRFFQVRLQSVHQSSHDTVLISLSVHSDNQCRVPGTTGLVRCPPKKGMLSGDTPV